jgi:hypothetical protein
MNKMTSKLVTAILRGQQCSPGRRWHRAGVVGDVEAVS